MSRAIYSLICFEAILLEKTKTWWSTLFHAAPIVRLPSWGFGGIGSGLLKEEIKWQVVLCRRL